MQVGPTGSPLHEPGLSPGAWARKGLRLIWQGHSPMKLGAGACEPWRCLFLD